MANMVKYLTGLLLSLSLVACGTHSEQDTFSKNTQKILKRQPTVALALGGGAAKGFAHIGVIKVLEKEGIKVNIITGTSAGSVVGSLYAYGRNASQLETEAMNLDQFDVADFSLSFKGLIKGEKLASYINNKVNNKPIESFPRKFAAVATELDNGKMTIFSKGNTGQAVRASASIPNIFQPTVIRGKSYVDGGLVAPVPVSAAKQLGADIVIAVDISAKPKKGVSPGFLSMLDQSLNIMSVAALQQELSKADVVIRPNIENLSSASFSQREEAILAGEVAARKAVPQIKALLAK
ncbi:patatin-like phospholipase family protein [Neisseria sp. Ec49-e6-T10]|uniref:patatin-like phospholipase family protein n=1 Tax=Neisseria sp. Ec49-e6-T10 TaxID=3140744 RepID=UPI003EBBEECF